MSFLPVSGAGLIVGGTVSGVGRSRFVEEALEPVHSWVGWAKKTKVVQSFSASILCEGQ